MGILITCHRYNHPMYNMPKTRVPIIHRKIQVSQFGAKPEVPAEETRRRREPVCPEASQGLRGIR